MIGIFPDPYPDEIFYSICARLCEHAGYSKHRIAMRDIFGCEAVIASVVLPSRLDDLEARLPPGSAYTADYLIAEHSLLPFYSPFLPPERLSRLRQDMRGRKGPAIHMRSGIMASNVPLSNWLRFCPRCVVEDRDCHGECYWHRVHQVSGVEICPFHEVYLQDSNVRARNQKTRHEFVSAERSVREIERQQPGSRSPYHQTLLDIARDAYWLLWQRNLSQDLTLLQHRYRRLLSEIDLATYRGRVDISMFLQKFRNCYPPQLLQILHCELEEHIQESWLLRLVRTPHSAQHPLHHLLLIRFLGYTVEDFFSFPSENKPFGVGPWPCLNPTCEHYRQPCIRECRIVHSQNVRGKPIGTFVCICGFMYSRTGPDTIGNNQFQRNKIKAFGSLWETRLQVLWEDASVSLRAIAHQLGVDPLTVKRQATRIGLPFPRSVRRCFPLKIPEKPSLSLAQISERAALETNRTTWLATIQEHPGAGVKMLRSMEPGSYTWLYRNDKMWLLEHTPLCEKPKTQPHRVDWEKRDLQLAEDVEVAALLIKNLPGRPVHITISTIGRETGRLALLQQHLDKLPRTAGVLKEFVETREEFAVRRLWWAVTVLSLEHIYPERWLLIRKAGVARLIDQPEVKDAIDAALQILQPKVSINIVES
jgi:Tn7-like transposition protein D/TniQ